VRSAPHPNVILYAGLAVTAIGLVTLPVEVRVVFGVAGAVVTILATIGYGLWYRGRHRP
jgi:hypothetical protein